MLIAESIFLLLTPPDGKGSHATAAGGVALRAGLVGDLLVGNFAELSHDKKPRLYVTGAAHTESASQSPLVRHGLQMIQNDDGVWLQSIVQNKKFLSAKEVAHNLVEQGVLERVDGKVLLIPRVRYAEANAAPEARLRRHLAAVVEERNRPGVEDAIILGILNGINQLSFVFRDEVTLSGKQLRKRAQAISQEVGESSALGNAVQQICSSVAIAMAAGVAVGGVLSTMN